MSDSEEQDATVSAAKETPDSVKLRKRQGRAESPGTSARVDKKTQLDAKGDDEDELIMMKHSTSVYALVPDKIWVYANHRWSFLFFGSIAFGFLALTCFMAPTFETIRLSYTLVACSLLSYRFKLYYKKQWLAFFIELCYVVSFFLIGSLWICPAYGCSEDWTVGVFIAATGAVAGSTFPLQMGLALHHPEAFETFFLHNTPMWVCYAIKWRNMLPLPVHHSLLHLVWLGMKVYLLWVMVYWPCLLVQPFMPDFITGAETLPDGFLYPGGTKEHRIKEKRGNYKNWVKYMTLGTLAHCGLSTTGFLAAAMCFQYHTVQVAWIFAVLVGCVDSARGFYKRSNDSTIPDPGLIGGLKKMCYAWVILIPAYTGSMWLDETMWS